MSSQSSFTGRARRKRTPWTVRASDALAQRIIAVGGIGTIAAVSLVFISLFFVVAPLFYAARIEPGESRPTPWGDTGVMHFVIDEYQTMAWALYPNGTLQVFQLVDGETLLTEDLTEGLAVGCVSSSRVSDEIGLGLADGTIRFGAIHFEASFHEAEDVPVPLRQLSTGETAIWDGGVVQRTTQGQFRLQRVQHKWQEPIKVASGGVQLLDHVMPTSNGMSGPQFTFAFVAADGTAQLGKTVAKENQFTGEVELATELRDLPRVPKGGESPFRILLTGRGDNVYLVWPAGRLVRFDTRRWDAVAVVEEVDLTTPDDGRLTVCDFVLGRESIVCGDAQGNLNAWFRVPVPAGTIDGFRLTRVHQLASADSAVRSFSASRRSRMIAVGYDDGRMRVYQVTANQMLAERQAADQAPIESIMMAPKDNGLLAISRNSIWRAGFEPLHPEATLASLFRPVWYEGYAKPQHIWQSSYATSAPESKFGMRNLVFGTLKATFYTMLFGAPLALLAAVYTSEFMQPRARNIIKPTLEMMASLPSVVLGFLAALVFAPLVERHVAAVLATCLGVPLAYLLGAHLWQLLPQRRLLQWSRFRLLFLAIPLLAGVPVSLFLGGPVVEYGLFAGDTAKWLDGQIGSGVGGWLLLWVPISAIAAVGFTSTFIKPWLRHRADRWSRQQFAVMSLIQFLGTTVLTLGLAYAISWLLNRCGWDPRGSYIDTYEQRNALVVGYVMGFAVIPIIYTIADDALSTVPNHLRSASLGCGATPWQTAVRVVIPTAMSGLFSALMIGLGRAVGETMIVLMAGGNTPVADWNIFNGFRTLSANIAVELPEAVKDSTHFRTLFLAALTLFVLTFLVNTIAEIIRLRFRRKAHQL